MKRFICYPEEKALGLMFGMVLGDAIGATFNDKKPDEIPMLDIEYLKTHPPHFYSDDTQMALSVIEEMVENKFIDQASLQRRFIKRYSPRRGYGGGMLTVLEKWQAGESIGNAASALYGGSGNFGDGAAVRSSPIGLFFKQDEISALFEQVTRCALLTHTHPYGVAGAQVHATAILCALNNMPEEEWIRWMFKLPIESSFKIKLGHVGICLERLDTAQQSAKLIGNGAQAIEAVPAALYAALRYPNSVIDAVLFAVSMGGDCDTIGAMAGALVGARQGLHNIPPYLIAGIENENEGRDFIARLLKRGLHLET